MNLNSKYMRTGSRPTFASFNNGAFAIGKGNSTKCTEIFMQKSAWILVQLRYLKSSYSSEIRIHCKFAYRSRVLLHFPGLLSRSCAQNNF